jgi:hypothetical protein
MNGDYRVRNPRILELHKRAKLLSSRFAGFEIVWIPREQNQEADSLTNMAYNRAFSDTLVQGEKRDLKEQG